MKELVRLVESARGGDLDAFGQIVGRFQDMAYGCAYAVVGDFHMAQDVAQEAFLEAYRSLDKLQDPRAFPGWFRRIVLHCCNRATRRKQPDVTANDALAVRAAPQPEPSAEAAAREMKDNVLTAIRSLPERERMVTTLFYINGYSQEDIAGFLEVPITTVKNRLHTSRKRLKERMMDMVEETLKEHAPDERLSRRIIEELLGRPDLLTVEGHPVREAWEAVRQALAAYEVVTGNELEDRQTFAAAQDHAWEHAYRVEDKALRYQMTTVTMSALAGRTPPVRLLAAGRVFRPNREDTTHNKIFHQVDAVCVATGANVEAFKTSCELAVLAALPSAQIEWRESNYPLVAPGFSAFVVMGTKRLEVMGGGMLKAHTLREKDYDPEKLGGFAWGLSLDRLVMLRHDIDDIRKLWQAPYVKTQPAPKVPKVLMQKVARAPQVYRVHWDARFKVLPWTEDKTPDIAEFLFGTGTQCFTDVPECADGTRESATRYVTRAIEYCRSNGTTQISADASSLVYDKGTGQLVAVCLACGTNVYHIEVAPAHRRQGIGMKILKRFLTVHARHGSPQVHNWCAEKSPEAALCQRLGFVLTGEVEWMGDWG